MSADRSAANISKYAEADLNAQLQYEITPRDPDSQTKISLWTAFHYSLEQGKFPSTEKLTKVIASCMCDTNKDIEQDIYELVYTQCRNKGKAGLVVLLVSLLRPTDFKIWANLLDQSEKERFVAHLLRIANEDNDLQRYTLSHVNRAIVDDLIATPPHNQLRETYLRPRNRSKPAANSPFGPPDASQTMPTYPAHPQSGNEPPKLPSIEQMMIKRRRME